MPHSQARHLQQPTCWTLLAKWAAQFQSIRAAKQLPFEDAFDGSRRMSIRPTIDAANDQALCSAFFLPLVPAKQSALKKANQFSIAKSKWPANKATISSAYATTTCTA